ncbi:MAG: MATE family efflux transporter [Clostridia bacterium]|nr:MATE family efflux transporter [Clostridia bacterium]
MTKADLYFEKMTKTPVAKLVVSLGIPTTVSMLITSIYNLVDTYFVGTLGETSQAATGVLFTLQSVIQAFAFMLGHGSGTYVSKALADKNIKESSQYVSTAFFTGGFIGTLLMTLGLAFLSPLVTLLGSTETAKPEAMQYGMWVLIACPFMICSLVLNNNLRYEGKALYSMIGLTFGGVLNIFGDWYLVAVKGMGVFGAGLATAVSQMVSFTILLVLFIKTAQSKLHFKHFTFSKKVHFEIVKGGFPSLIRQGLNSISGAVLNNSIKLCVAVDMRDAAMAAMTIVNRFSMFVMCVGLGIGQGFQPVAAFNYRAKYYDRVKKALLSTILIGVCLMLIFAMTGIVFADGIVGLLQKEGATEVKALAVPAMRYACSAIIFLSVSVPANMLFQSIRKAGIASFLSMLRSGAILIPMILIGSSTLGFLGIQLAQPISDVLTGLICLPFIIVFLKKKNFDDDNKK